MAYPRLADGTPDALEREVLARWKDEDLFRRTLETSARGKPFVFYEGPPTANGRPGIHHVFARTIKDLVCRYHTMLGEGVTRDRKSTRLNSSHLVISYAVFCLKKKNNLLHIAHFLHTLFLH